MSTRETNGLKQLLERKSRHVEGRVIDKIRERRKIGLEKYGVTMERDDLSDWEWLNHLQQELLDGAIYVEKILGRIKS